MNREEIIRMAREVWGDDSGKPWHESAVTHLEAFAKLVAAAERERLKWDGLHSCHSECDRPACVNMRKAVEAEREACAKVCDDIARLYSTDIFPENGTSIDCNSAKMGRVVTKNCAQSIRARGQG